MRKLLLVFLWAFTTAAFTKPTQYLFFQTASEGMLTKLHKQNYLLVLNALPAHVHYFNIAPNKKVGVLNLSKFLSLWRDETLGHNFVNNPPNAVISMISRKGKQQILVAIVSNPGFDQGRVSYQISVLDERQIELGAFKNIVLYFDDIDWNPARL